MLRVLLVLFAWIVLAEKNFLDWLASPRTVPPPAWVTPEMRRVALTGRYRP